MFASPPSSGGHTVSSDPPSSSLYPSSSSESGSGSNQTQPLLTMKNYTRNNTSQQHTSYGGCGFQSLAVPGAPLPLRDWETKPPRPDSDSDRTIRPKPKTRPQPKLRVEIPKINGRPPMLVRSGRLRTPMPPPIPEEDEAAQVSAYHASRAGDDTPKTETGTGTGTGYGSITSTVAQPRCVEHFGDEEALRTHERLKNLRLGFWENGKWGSDESNTGTPRRRQSYSAPILNQSYDGGERAGYGTVDAPRRGGRLRVRRWEWCVDASMRAAFVVLWVVLLMLASCWVVVIVEAWWRNL
jgi:hypothetical protein